jgi:glycosyltransferase involved in cell wall biosynthesis
LKRALQSISGQCYGNWEAIVVNDGGVPVREVVDDFADPQRLRYVDRDSSGGPSAARNVGLALATGEIVTYLDDDDRFLPNHLTTIADAFRDQSVHVAYTEAEYVLERECDGIQVDVSRSLPYSGIEYSRRLLLVQNFIPQVVLAHRRECLDVVGRFDESFPALVDWEFFLRLSEHYAFLHIPQVTVEARTVVDGRTNVSRSRRARFPELFARVYIRHPDAGDLWVRQQREKMLQQLFSGDDPPARVKTSGGMSTSEGRDAERYARWVERHTLSESSAQYMAERMMLEWRSQPLFHILILHERGEEEALADTLDSLGRQLYRGWGVSVISEAMAPDGFDSVPNVEWVTVEGNRFDAANTVAWQSTADWILLLEPGSRVVPETLLSTADYLQKFPGWRLVYADEDRISLSGERHDPLFKPDFNLDLLRSTCYVGKYIAVRRELLVRIGGVRDHGEATAYDLVFRVLEAAGEGSIGHIAKVLFHRSDRFQRRYDPAAASEESRRVVQAHLERVGVRATVSKGQRALTQTVDYAFDRAPRVSVIVPTRDQAALLQACVDSVLEITSYPDYEVLIVDNGSTEASALSYLNAVSMRDARVRVLRYERPYSFSAINNFAAAHASGEILLLLNNDTQVLHDDWMTRMVGNVLRPEVGAVGARLVFPDGRIQHAGVVLGLMGTADHPDIGTPMAEPGYMGRLQVAQNYSAVTGACLMVRKAVYEQVGGLDEHDFNVLFNDVDFCLKLVMAGHWNVWTPQATLVHHASVSIKANVDAAAVERAFQERAALQERWRGWLASDPAFNRNLSLASQRVCVESEIAPAWDPTFRDRPRLMAFPLDAQGTGHYRVWGPLAALDRASLAQFSLLPAHGFRAKQVRVPNLPELLRAAPDTLLVQHGYLDLFLDWIERYRRHSRTFLVFGQDDNLLDVPDENPLKRTLVDGLEHRMARALGQCDRLIVTTPPLVEVYRRFIDDIRVVPNQLDGSRWLGLESKRRAGRKPRVGWAGALQHLGDLKWLEPVVRALHREVEWVFMGMCPDNLRPYVAEFHAPVPLPQYPSALAGLNLDLAIAPLEMNRFNEAKSDLRILEYGALGWPVIATDIYPYQGKPVPVLANQPDCWVAAIRERVNDLDALALEGDRLREWVLNSRLLENNLDVWLRALFSDEVLREYGVLRALAA